MDAGTRAWRVVMHAALRLYLVLLGAATRFGPATPRPARGRQILLTGTFQSHNWIRAHIGPLAASSECAGLTMVTASTLPPLPKVRALSPPAWLAAIGGETPARLLTFVAAGLWLRPDVIGGFHLLVNGLVAALLARVAGAESWYFAVGGPTELLDGGVRGENPYFARLRVPDPLVEGRLLQAVANVDLVITMGSGARDFLRAHEVKSNIEIVAGGIDPIAFDANRRAPEFDLVLVARLVPIKQIDLYLRVIALVQRSVPGVKAAIVGDGPLRAELEREAASLGIREAVTFAGQQSDVAAWLSRSRIFMLTSSSEGLALSLMEAMMCGLPAVVSRVGDLSDLVSEGENGYLIEGSSAEAFAAAIVPLLQDAPRYAAFSHAARRSALRYTTEATTLKWNEILARP
ncbi:MAG: glycosyltransferase [Acidobacteriota bacterium]